MPKQRKRQIKPETPKYCCQKRPAGRDAAYVFLDGRRHYLGVYGSDESLARYSTLIAEWIANGRKLPHDDEHDITVAELLSRYLAHCEQHYRDCERQQTTGIVNVKAATRWLSETAGPVKVHRYGPLMLKAMRAEMVTAGYARRTVNRYVEACRRVFKWGVGEELVPPQVYQALAAVEGLRAGRTDARETRPVKPVPDEHVDAVLPLLTPTVAAMVRLQRCTGMRPCEVCALRPADITVAPEVWTARLDRHKTAHHGHERVIFIGPRGQEILRPLLTPDRPLGKPLFSAQQSEQECLARRHEKRTTPLSCGNRPGSNRVRKPQRPAGEQFTTGSYGRAIQRACDRAGVPRWSPNRLRHNFATDVRREHGLEAAQVLLGHAKADITQVYAEANREHAQRIAAIVG